MQSLSARARLIQDHAPTTYNASTICWYGSELDLAYLQLNFLTDAAIKLCAGCPSKVSKCKELRLLERGLPVKTVVTSDQCMCGDKHDLVTGLQIHFGGRMFLPVRVKKVKPSKMFWLPPWGLDHWLMVSRSSHCSTSNRDRGCEIPITILILLWPWHH